MAFKLMTMAEQRWHKRNGSDSVALVHAGVKFPDGHTRFWADMVADSVIDLPMDAASAQLAPHCI